MLWADLQPAGQSSLMEYLQALGGRHVHVYIFSMHTYTEHAMCMTVYRSIHSNYYNTSTVNTLKLQLTNYNTVLYL